MKSSTLKTKVETLCGHNLTIKAEYYWRKKKSAKAVLVCFPGGGASRQFFNLGTFSGFDYSFASRMTAKGYHVIAIDHLGTGENPLPNDMGFLKPIYAVQYMAWALDDILLKTRQTGKNIIGIGHSMGGMITTLLQSRQGMFTAICLLGSSAGGLDWGLSEEEKAYIEKPEDFARDMEKLTIAKFGSDFIKYPNQGPSGKSITFGGETPELTERLRDITTTLYAAGGMMSMTRGSFRSDVNAIDVPIFFAFGDHDIGIPPEDAPKDYINAPSHELVVLENTGHNSLAFSSIEVLCERLDEWVSSLKCGV